MMCYYFIAGYIHVFIVVWNFLNFGLMIYCYGPVRVEYNQVGPGSGP